MTEEGLRRYIVSYKEQSVGPQCNNGSVFVVESRDVPTQGLLGENGLLPYTGICTNLSYPGCEECGGSRIVDFKVEEYSPERADELGLVERIRDGDGRESTRDKQVRRLTPKQE